MRFFASFYIYLACLAAVPAFAAEPGATPDLATRWGSYGQGLLNQEKYTEAKQAFETGLKLAPENASLLQGLGNACWKLDDKDAALAAWEKSLQFKPDNQSLQAFVDQLKARQAQAAAPAASEAQSEAAPEAAVDEDYEEGLAEARTLVEQRDFKAALEALDPLEARGKGQAPWLQCRAEALYGLGRIEEARSDMQSALLADPESKAAKQWLEGYLHPGAASPGGGEGAGWFQPLWRSALLPGWGQAYNGRKERALAVGTVTLALFGGTLATYAAADQALSDYRALGPGSSDADFDAAFSKADGLVLANQALGLLFYSAYAYNLFDAATGARAPVAVGLRRGAPVLAYSHRF